MASAPEVEVEVVYATPARQTIRTVRLPAGSAVEEAIRRSGLLAEFPEIDLAANRVGVYGEAVTLDAAVRGGERVEIYRPLIADPKEARRRRARAGSRGPA
jgi:putative ubiquitin-RnfH superfamily antitoxin RatB of RatAB toxin-antitoxin module